MNSFFPTPDDGAVFLKRRATAPAAILTARADSFLALASIVADDMYGKPIPIVALDPGDFEALRTGQRLRVRRDGTVEVD